MKHNKLLILAILFMTVRANAQYSGGVGYPTAYGAFSIGVSLPMGAFGSASPKDWTGYANTGMAYQISVGIPFSKSNFGIAVLGGFDKNSYDAGSYGSTLSKNDTSNTYSTVTAISYSQYYLMGGIFASSNTHNGFSVDGRLVGGFIYINYPSPYWTTSLNSNPTIQESWYQNTTPTTTFAIDLGVGMRYYFESGFTVLASFDFLHTNANITTQQLIDSGNNQTQTTLSNSLSITSFNITVGVGYSL